MKRAILSLVLLSAAVLVYAQQKPRPISKTEYPEWEVKVLEPREIAAGRYHQVRPHELDTAAQEGWELVSMTTFCLRNEEHEGLKGERPIVTQAYLSYAFKRLKRDPLR